MMKLVTVAEMRAMEAEANARGVSYETMMERAGLGVARFVNENLYVGEDEKIAVGLVGSGNNGGDALVTLAALARMGWTVRAYLTSTPDRSHPLMKRLLDFDAELVEMAQDAEFQRLDGWLESAAVILDGVLGTGIHLPLRPETARLLGHVAEFDPPGTVVAVDCPSGVDCESGEMAEETIPADVTLCMDAVKVGLMRFPAYAAIGDLQVIDLELPEDLPTEKSLRRSVADYDMVGERLPLRALDAHKGSFGTVMAAVGSIPYTGAAYLAGMAAYRVGAGLVRMAVPGPLHAALAGKFPEATWLLLPHEMGVIAAAGAELLLKNLDRVTALLVGPGLGLEETTGEFLAHLLTGKSSKTARHPLGFGSAAQNHETAEHLAALPPLVMDADGLRLLAKMENWPARLPEGCILTPHAGEMAALTGLSVEEIQAERMAVAEKYAQEWGQVVILKGALTVVAAPDGRVTVIPIATPALARAGTGDVLAGAAAGFRAQGLEAFDAAVCAAFIHGEAGLAASRTSAEASVVAGDLLPLIPAVMSLF